MLRTLEADVDIDVLCLEGSRRGFPAELCVHTRLALRGGREKRLRVAGKCGECRGERPCGILVGSGGTADLIPELLERIKERPKGHIIIDENPENLVKKVVAFLDEEFSDIDTEDYINQWFLKASKGSHTG